MNAPAIIGGIGFGAVLYITTHYWPARKGWLVWLTGLAVLIASSGAIRWIVGLYGEMSWTYSLIGLGLAFAVGIVDSALRRRGVVEASFTGTPPDIRHLRVSGRIYAAIWPRRMGGRTSLVRVDGDCDRRWSGVRIGRLVVAVRIP